MGIDRKYGRVTTEHGDIPDDEPVIVFRARDLFTVPILKFYAQMCEAEGSPPRHVELVRGTRDEFQRWQNAHPDQVRIPDSERSRAWMAD